MERNNLLSELAQAIVDMDEDAAKAIARTIVAEKLDAALAIEKGLGAGMEIVGERYEAGEYFIPDILLSAEAAESASKILKGAVVKSLSVKGRVIIGTVRGDTHDIGKNIVALFLSSAGYEVLDLGKDVSAEVFADKAVEWGADVIAMSTLLTTTMNNMKEVIELLCAKGVREKFIIIIGGKPTSEEFAKKIGADGYSESAVSAVKLLERLTKQYKQENKINE